MSDAEWHAARKSTIGGSEAAAVVNKSKWMTPNDLYNKLVSGKEKSVSENDRMRVGTLAERYIRDLFALHHKRFIIKNPPMRKHWFFVRKDKPYLSCTPDGIATDTFTKEKWGVEIKDVELRTNADKNAWEGNLLPDQYYYQILQYMVVCNDLSGVVIVANLSYFKHNEDTDKWEYDYSKIVPYYIYRNEVETHIAYLERKETEFYEKNIKGRKRPKTIIKF